SFVSWARVHIYETPQKALEIEPEYIIKRNSPEDEEKEGGE
ncbi:MAG TPA: 30S ribosomal protein S24e, partial [Thermofilum sp.]|nr:30S ribosomal protein S24e [Thermofilum sp.]